MAVGVSETEARGQFLRACEAETLLIAAFLGFGSLADTVALIAKVCFVLFPDLRHRVIPQKRSPTALRYQEGLTKPFHPPKLHPGLIAIGVLSPAALPTRYFRLGSFKALMTTAYGHLPVLKIAFFVDEDARGGSAG
jgi:hypothetical protein